MLQAALIALGLGMDAMSVSAAIGVTWNGPRQKFRLAWHMGLFQLLMPCIGFALGRPLASMLSNWGTYVASGLVFALGVKMLYEVIKEHPGAVAEGIEHAQERAMGRGGKDPTKGWSLVVLSVATSLDALVVGFSLSLKQTSSGIGPWVYVLQSSVIIGLVAAAMALAGVVIGKRLGKALGKWGETVGALVLIGLAISFLML